MLLMPIADADHWIQYADVACQGEYMGGVIANTTFYQKVIKNKLQLPQPTFILEKTQVVNLFVLAADNAFAQSS